MKNHVILGATSEIAMEVSKVLAARGDGLYLVARNEAKVKAIKKDLTTRGAGKVEYTVVDCDNFEHHVQLLEAVKEAVGVPDTVLFAYGILGNQREAETSYLAAEQVLKTNFLSVVSLATLFANQLETAGKGTLAFISSVAGDRGRKNNYVYGTAKGAVSLFAQGLRNRLASKGVHILTVKPGFVDTPMTKDVKKGPLFAKAKAVGEGIVSALDAKKDIVYLPWFWRYIMLIIKVIPEFIFKKTSI